MSEVIKTVFVNYIFCALVGGLLEYFAPQNARKTLRVAVVSFMLVFSLAPLLKLEFDFGEIPSGQEINESVGYDALMHTANLTEKKIYNEMRDILINLGVDEYEIYVTTSVEKDVGTVYLEGIKIEVAEEFKDKIPDIAKMVPVEYEPVFTVTSVS